MVRTRNIILLILNDRQHLIHGLVESLELAYGIAVGVIHFNFRLMLIFRLVFVILLDDLFEATRLAKLNGHLARTAIVGPFIRGLDSLDGR